MYCDVAAAAVRLGTGGALLKRGSMLLPPLAGSETRGYLLAGIGAWMTGEGVWCVGDLDGSLCDARDVGAGERAAEAARFGS